MESPPPLIGQSVPEYVAPPPAPPYWYFCQSFNAYYPQAPTCPEPWLTGSGTTVLTATVVG